MNWGNQEHKKGKWFDTSDGPGWGDAGAIELKNKDGFVIQAQMEIEEFFTGEDEIPSPRLSDPTLGSFYDFEKWRAL